MSNFFHLIFWRNPKLLSQRVHFLPKFWKNIHPCLFLSCSYINIYKYTHCTFFSDGLCQWIILKFAQILWIKNFEYFDDLITTIINIQPIIKILWFYCFIRILFKFLVVWIYFNQANWFWLIFHYNDVYRSSEC